MPELPEVEALAAYLRERAQGQEITRIEVAAISALKTFDPPVNAATGQQITGAGRHGKFLDVFIGADLHLVVHLSRAGWLHYRDSFSGTALLKPGRGPIALRVRLADGSGFDLTEQGTQKRLAAYLVRDPQDVPGVAKLGPDALAIGREEFEQRLRARRGQVKGVLTEQDVLAGVGNAYSDEILHTAKMSPFALTHKLTAAQYDQLYDAMRAELTDAVARSVGQGAAEAEGREALGPGGTRPERAALSGMRVNHPGGLVCRLQPAVLPGVPDRR